MAAAITGRQITKELRGQWHAGKGMCFCPAHDDKHDYSLSVAEVPGRILLHCFAGCSFPAIADALRARGLWPARDDDGFSYKRSTALKREATPETDEFELAKEKAARAIWQHRKPIAGSAAALYLWSRGIDTAHLPPTLGCIPELYSREVGKTYPALIGAIQNSAGRVTSVQRIWVTKTLIVTDGVLPAKGTKAPLKVPKKTLGPMGDGAVRLGRPGRTIGIAEGIETGLSAQQIYRLPVWVSCGAWRMSSIKLPEIVERVVLFGDHGESGEEAAAKAYEAFEAQGYTVDVEFPPAGYGDFNDLIVARPGRAA
jgi:putative DNA primase/helicase